MFQIFVTLWKLVEGILCCGFCRRGSSSHKGRYGTSTGTGPATGPGMMSSNNGGMYGQQGAPYMAQASAGPEMGAGPGAGMGARGAAAEYYNRDAAPNAGLGDGNFGPGAKATY